MSPDITLYTYTLAPYVQGIHAFLEESGFELEIIEVDVKMNKPAWFEALSPTGNVPLLKVGERLLFESSVILEYLDEISGGRFQPKDILKKAHHRSWKVFGDMLLNDLLHVMVAPSDQELEEKQAVFHRHCAVLEKELGEGPWFDGKDVSLVDFSYAALFTRYDFLVRVFGFAKLDAFPKVAAWSRQILERSSMTASVPENFEQVNIGWLHSCHSAIAKRGA